MKTSELINEFTSALNEEIEYIKSKGGGMVIIGKDASLLGKRHDKYIYEITIENPQDLPDDTPIEIRSLDETSRGTIVSLDGNKLLVALEDNIGKFLPEVKILANPYYLLEMLKKRLQEENLDYDLAQKVFGYKKYEVDELPLENSDGLNDSQHKAICKALGSEVSFIWGPPGTGKTLAISYLISRMAEKDNSVLMVSHTNIAIDNVMEKIAQAMKGKQEYERGEVLRYGDPYLNYLFDKYPKLSVEYWIEDRSRELITKKNVFKEERGKIESSIKDILNTIETLERLNLKKDELSKRYKKREESSARANSVAVKLEETKQEINKINNIIQKSKEMSSFNKLIRGINPEKLVIERMELLSNEKVIQDNVGRITKEFQKTETDINKLSTQIGKLEKELSSIKFQEDPNHLRQELEKLKENSQNIKVKISDIEEKIQNIEVEIIKQAKIVGTTITKTYSRDALYKRTFKDVVVDETSMAPMPALFFSLGLAKDRAVIVGDFRQLPPIARSDGGMVEKWLKRDIFEQSGITATVDSGADLPQLTQLVKQYRMTEEISSLINDIVYKGALINIEKSGDNKIKEVFVLKNKPFPGSSVVICDTSRFNPWSSITPTFSHFNLYEADLSMHLAKQAAVNDIKSSIISPYRAQTSLIMKLISSIKDKEIKGLLNASVIHQAQGREKDLLIWNLVDGTGGWVGKGLKGSFGSAAMKLVNVAVSRARSKLIIVCNLNYFLTKLKDNDALRKILLKAKEEGKVVDATEIFNFVSTDDDRELVDQVIIEGSDIRDRIEFIDQSNFYARFFDDLDKYCQEELIIFSPFISRKRLGEVMPVLQRLTAKNVEVTILTKPPGVQSDLFNNEDTQELIKNIEEAGLIAVRKSRMHEKLAIIDKKIIWHGSLNILSHRHTTETMTRIQTQGAAEEILKLLKVNSLIKQSGMLKKIKGLKYGECPTHKKPLEVASGRYGLFLTCPKPPRYHHTENIPVDLIKIIFGEEYLKCEECGGEMTIKRSRRGRFLGCESYPKCKFTRSL